MDYEKNMFELWRDKELPKEYQELIDTKVQIYKPDEREFAAGFFIGKYIKEIRLAMGINE